MKGVAKNGLIDIKIVDFLKAVTEDSDYYNESAIGLFSVLREHSLDDGREEGGTKKFLLACYKKFYDNLEKYIDFFHGCSRIVIVERYGLCDGIPKTYSYIIETYGLRKPRILNVEKYCIKQLKSMSYYREIEGSLLDPEEYTDYLVKTKGEFYVKAKDLNLQDIVGFTVSVELLNKYNIADVLKFREFLLELGKGNPISEDDLYKLFTSLNGVGYTRAWNAIENMKDSDVWEFLIGEKR